MSMIWRGIGVVADEVTEFFWVAFKWTFSITFVFVFIYSIFTAFVAMSLWGHITVSELDNPWVGFFLALTKYYYYNFLNEAWWMWVVAPFTCGLIVGLTINVVMWLIIFKIPGTIFGDKS